MLHLISKMSVSTLFRKHEDMEQCYQTKQFDLSQLKDWYPAPYHNEKNSKYPRKQKELLSVLDFSACTIFTDMTDFIDQEENERIGYTRNMYLSSKLALNKSVNQMDVHWGIVYPKEITKERWKKYHIMEVIVNGCRYDFVVRPDQIRSINSVGVNDVNEVNETRWWIKFDVPLFTGKFPYSQIQFNVTFPSKDRPTLSVPVTELVSSFLNSREELWRHKGPLLCVGRGSIFKSDRIVTSYLFCDNGTIGSTSYDKWFVDVKGKKIEVNDIIVSAQSRMRARAIRKKYLLTRRLCSDVISLILAY